MKSSYWILFPLTLICFVFIAYACGDAPKNSALQPKYSRAALAGNYLMGLASCTDGQFDPSLGKGFLDYNSRMTKLKNDGLKVTVSIQNDQMMIKAPASIYGTGSQACLITTVEAITYPTDQAINRKLLSRACSSTCSTVECKEEASVAGATPQSYDVSINKGVLYLVDDSSRGACTRGSSSFAAQVELIRQ
jgi:hypothetical protein